MMAVKGTKFAYKEMKNRKKTELNKVAYCCEMDRIEEAVWNRAWFDKMRKQSQTVHSE